MKKILTLALVICMVAACTLTAGAVSYGFDAIRGEYVLNNPTSSLGDGAESDFYAQYTPTDVQFAYDEENGVISGTKAAEISRAIDIRNTSIDDYLSGNYNLLSFQFKVSNNSANCQLVIGNGTSADNNAYAYLKFSGASVYARNGSKEDVIVNDYNWNYSSYTTVKVLLDTDKEKYYVWLGSEQDDINIFTEEPLIDGYDFVTDYDGNLSYFRFWRGQNSSAGALYMKEFRATPLEKTLLVGKPSLGTATPAYNQEFDELEGDSADWGLDNYEFKVRSKSAAAAQSNQSEMSITDDDRLEIMATSKYHNWHFTKAEDYVAPSTDNLVIQVDIKSNSSAAIYLGSRAASAVPIAVYAKSGVVGVFANGGTEESLNSKCSFVHTSNFDSADLTTVTFLIHNSENKYSVWFDDVCAVKYKDFNSTTNTIDSVNFFSDSNATIHVDNIRVFAVADDAFLKVYNFMNTEHSFSDFVNLGSDSKIVSFKSADEVFGADSGITASYNDSNGYYDETNGIQFPLFSGSTDARVILSDGNNILASVATESAIEIPAAYTSFSLTGNTLSATARKTNGEIKVIAVCYDSDTDALLKAAVQENTLDTDGFIDITFNETLPENSYIKVFVWEDGTLTPIVENPVQSVQ